MIERAVIGVACLGRKTFDVTAAEKIYRTLKNSILERSDVNWEFIDELLFELPDARRAADRFTRKGVDGVILISGTFHLGHLAMEIEGRLKKPVLLQALPELPYDGGKIRLNSICGVNLDASNLYKSGVRNYHTCIGTEVDHSWIDAIKVLKTLSTAHIGLLGYRASGFFTLGTYDPALKSRFGVLMDHYELADLLKRDPAHTEEYRKLLCDSFDAASLDERRISLTAQLADRFDSFMEDNNLDALAVRCWPEFADLYGIAPCAAMSLLQARGRILACEGDAEGALSMLAQKMVSGNTPYLFDFSQVDFEQNYALLWHCGVAPVNLWDGRSPKTLDTYFAGGRGVTAGFVLSEGHVSILRFDAAGPDQRVFLASAEGIPAEKELSGTYLKAVFKNPVKDVLDTILRNGIAHHASMVYGKHIEPFKILARIKGWSVLES